MKWYSAISTIWCGQYGNLWLNGAALLHRALELPLLPWHRPSAERWEWFTSLRVRVRKRIGELANIYQI
ncbi:hypothetical protein MHYP_G00136310 [Metynnis hypsauchen]